MEEKPNAAPAPAATRPVHHHAEDAGMPAAQLVAFCRLHGVTVTTEMSAEDFAQARHAFLHGRL